VTRTQLIHVPSLATDRIQAIPTTPDYFTFQALPYEVTDDTPQPQRWLRFLEELWPNDSESIQLLQEWFGYCLTSDTSQHKMLLLVGPPRSGKGTMARVLRELLGTENAAGPSLSSLAQSFGLAPLLSAKVAIIPDARLSAYADQGVIVERLLSITGEDALTVDIKYREPITCKLNTRIMLLTNELPRLTDISGALAKRMLVLELENSFYGQEDPHLFAELQQELPGILRWAAEGWTRLQTRGHFVEPASSQDLHQEFEELASPISVFLKDRCVVGPEQTVARGALYDAYCGWCRQTGRQPSTSAMFGRDLRAAVRNLRTSQPRKTTATRSRQYLGVGLKPSR